MDVPGLSYSPGVGIDKRDTLIHCCTYLLPPYPFRSRERFRVSYLFIFVFIFYSLEAICKNRNYLYKVRGGEVVIFFFP